MIISTKCQYKGSNNKRIAIVRMPMEEQIGGSYRKYARNVYKVFYKWTLQYC